MIGDRERGLPAMASVIAIESGDLEIAMLLHPRSLAARMIKSFRTASCLAFLIGTGTRCRARTPRSADQVQSAAGNAKQ
jgi:hypothetical protein